MKAAAILTVMVPMWAALLLAGSEPGQVRAAPDATAGLPVSCSAPRDDVESGLCADLQRRALEVTVFLRFKLRYGWQDGRLESELITSHATILDGRTLLTHDHYDSLLDSACTVAALEVMSARGSRHFIIEDEADAVVLADLVRQLRSDPTGHCPQTRLLRFPMPLFTPVDGLGFELFASPPSRRILAGWGELAEVNWAKSRGPAYVQWVRPLYAGVQGDAIALVVGEAVGTGASGGGVFRVTPGGLVHVGNIWGTWHDDDTSIVALNQAAALGR